MGESAAIKQVGTAGWADSDGVVYVPVNYKVIHPGHGDGLRCVPVRGGEGQAGRTHRALSRVAADQRDGDSRRRLAVQLDAEGHRFPGLAGCSTCCRKVHPHAVIIRIAQANGRDRYAAVERIAAAGWANADGVGHRPVNHKVVYARHGDGLRDAPVRGGEGQASRTHRALSLVIAIQRNRDIRRWLACQRHAKGCCATRLRRDQPARRADCHSGGVVIGDVRAHTGNDYRVVIRIRARGAVRDLAEVWVLGNRVVKRRDRYRLRLIPVSWREGQAQRGKSGRRRTDAQLSIGANRNHHIGDGLAAQFYGIGGGLPTLCQTQRCGRCHDHPGAVVINVRQRNGFQSKAVVHRRATAGRADLHAVDSIAIGNRIIYAGDGDGLWHIPVPRRESQAHRANRPLAYVITGDRHRDIRQRLPSQRHLECDGIEVLAGGGAALRQDRQIGRNIVIYDLHRGERKCERAIEWIGAVHTKGDVSAMRPLGDQIVNRRHRDDSGRIPRVGRDRQHPAGLPVHIQFGIGSSGNHHRVRRLTVQRHANGCSCPTLRHRPTDGISGNPGGIVINVRQIDAARRHTAVNRVGIAGGANADGIRDIPIINIIIHAGDGDELRCIPGSRRESQAGRTHRTLGQIIACDRDSDIRRWFAIEPHLKGDTAACLAGAAAPEDLNIHPTSVVVIIC